MFKTALLIGVVVMGAQMAHAQELPARWESVDQRFSFSSNYSFYNCDVVETRTNEILAQMGAQNVQVECRGGLPHWDINWIYATYEVLKSTTEDKATTKGKKVVIGLNVDAECDLQETIVRTVSRKFEAKQLKKTGFCRNTQGNLTYEFDLFSLR